MPLPNGVLLIEAMRLLRVVQEHDDAIIKDDPWYALERSDREAINKLVQEVPYVSQA